MKPEAGGESTASEMAQEEFDPLDLMSGVAMLVLEARTPDHSVKGRVEGPHCPSFKQDGRHMCSKQTLECLRALEFRERIHMMWKNGIPSCIDILLFPACSHGLDEARSLEGMASNIHENSILLERWTIQCIQKWHGEWSSGVSGSMLLQAVRSYLYFSQLSSWLTSMHGCLPITIAYRLYAPGEEAGVNFMQSPDSHAFPTGIYGPHGLRVNVLALPRQEHVPALLCVLTGEQGGAESRLSGYGHAQDEANKEKSLEDDGGAYGGVRPKKPARCRESDNSPPVEQRGRRRVREHRSRASQQTSSTNKTQPRPGAPPQSTSTKQPHSDPPACGGKKLSRVLVSEESGAICKDVKVKGQRSSARESLEGQLRPLELSAAAPTRSDLHSPKVLMSAEAQMPQNLITKNKRIDFRNPNSRATDDHYPIFDPIEDHLFLTRHFRDLQSPLSPLDIQNFLANLQTISGPIPTHIRIPASLAGELAAKKTGEEWLEARLGNSTLNQLGRMPEAGLSLSAKKKQRALSGLSLADGSSQQESKFALRAAANDPHDVLTHFTLHGEKKQGQADLSSSATPLPADQDLYSLKKKKLIAAAQQWSDFLDESQREKPKEEQPCSPQSESKLTKKNHEFVDQFPSVGMSTSIDQTLRDIKKIVRARQTKSVDHDFQEVTPAAHTQSPETAISTSWSSSSSSSSSTYSSSPRVLRSLLDEGEKNSGSSTPTNCSTSPSSVNSRDVTSEVCRAGDKPNISNNANGEKIVRTGDVSVFPDSKSDQLVINGNASSSVGCQRRSSETPDAVNGAFPEGPAKRKLRLDFGADVVSATHSHKDDGLQSNIGADVRCSLDKNTVKSCERKTTDSYVNIPKSHIGSALKHVTSTDLVSAETSLQSQDDSEEQGPATDDSSSVHSQQNCDQGKASSNSSICKFYLESPLSPSPSFVSLSNGALSPKDLSACASNDADELLIKSWQKLSVDARSDESEKGSDFNNEKNQEIRDGLPSCVLDIESNESRNFRNSTHSSSFVSKVAAPTSGRATQNATHLTYQNGAVRSNDNTSGDGRDDDDEVFSDGHEVSRGKTHTGPTRAKSAPNFASMSAKASAATDEGRSNEGVTRGRLATRDKSWLEMGSKVTSPQERLRHRLVKSASMMFSSRSGLPSQSSPAPVKRRSTGRFDYDETLTNTKAIKSALSMSRLPDVSQYATDGKSESGRVLSTSAPASTNSLLGNFEESILNGRLEPAGVVDGFTVDIGASGSFCPRHLSLPVTAYFFHLSDDNAPSPYLGHIGLDDVGKKGYHIPRKGTLQVTLFNPNKTVVKMFVVMYDLADMPPDSQTVIRQRTVYMPVEPDSDEPSYLRYLIHLRVASSSSGKIYLHTDIRLIFARNKFELDSSVAKYELRSYTESPVNPKYSPKR